MLVRTSTTSLQTDFSLYVLTKWVTPVIQEESAADSYKLTEEEQKGQEEQQEPPEFGKASETHSHTLLDKHTTDRRTCCSSKNTRTFMKTVKTSQ